LTSRKEEEKQECSICVGKADESFKRVEVWSNDTWRLSMSTYKAVEGFCYLEPKRHIPNITDLDGREVTEFGSVMALVTNAIKNATDAKLVYVYIFGDHIPHLHVHLAPHKEGDVFVGDVIKSDAQKTLLEESLLNPEETLALTKRIREGIPAP
jgi:diadenosine tetraphosphate (Ap4A) HIT family hydrolase